MLNYRRVSPWIVEFGEIFLQTHWDGQIIGSFPKV